MTEILRILSRGKGCHHPDTIGCERINYIDIGLCVDCRKLINLKSGRIVGLKTNKEIVYSWFKEHPQEITNFNLWETI